MKKNEIEIDAAENIEINDQDLQEALADIEKYQLNDFDFDSVEELYLDDESDGQIYGFEF
jgi:hypothetical protein